MYSLGQDLRKTWIRCRISSGLGSLYLCFLLVLERLVMVFRSLIPQITLSFLFYLELRIQLTCLALPVDPRLGVSLLRNCHVGC